MYAIVFLQLLINAALLWWMWRTRSQTKATGTEPFLTPERASFSLESRLAQWEEELIRYRERARAQLTNLIRIGDEAQRILKRSQEDRVNPNPSTEECELKAATAIETETAESESHEPRPSADRIPTLDEMEHKKEILSRRPTLDLKTVLRDQLV